MWIDTHCHLDFIYNKNQLEINNFGEQELIDFVIAPSANHQSFACLVELSHLNSKFKPAFGFHPLYIKGLPDEAIQVLEKQIVSYKPIAIGEIGLDFYQNNKEFEALQVFYFEEQLKLAAKYSLPVILHVRSAIDRVISIVKKFPTVKGIAHAFNGSEQQAHILAKLGYKLGFGGAMTYSRALKIRNLAINLPLDYIVLETDAPDMNPAWLDKNKLNHPNEISRIGEFFASIRGMSKEELAKIIYNNTQQIFTQLN
jgi:TatD DNase family protein